MVVGIFPDRIEKPGVLYAFNSAFEVDVVITIFTADFFIMVILIMLLP
jgi:hypothetical protein